jgi:hypothetical protein
MPDHGHVDTKAALADDVCHAGHTWSRLDCGALIPLRAAHFIRPLRWELPHHRSYRSHHRSRGRLVMGADFGDGVPRQYGLLASMVMAANRPS